jgi:histidine triad (HIT) family protein
MADCLFCKIVAGEIPAAIVKRSPDAVAFRDIDAKAPVHVLVIPTRHIAAVRDAKGSEGEQLLGSLLAFAAEVATEQGLDRAGYRIVTNTGKHAGQSVDHLHLHLLGGRKLSWPPG